LWLNKNGIQLAEKESISTKHGGVVKVMVSLDLRNMIIPFCLLKASNAFRLLEQDEVLEIICNDPENIPNLMKIIPPNECQLISVEDLEGTESTLKVRLKKINP